MRIQQLEFSTIICTVYILVKRAYNFILILLAPPFCAHCRSYLSCRDVFCVDCSAKIIPLVSIEVPITKKYSMKVFAPGAYKGPLKKLILAKGRSDIVACGQLAELIWERTYLKNIHYDYCVPIPLHWTRRAKRGYNQAEEMAHVLAKKSGNPTVHLLKRHKRTKFQSTCSADGRTENLSGAFVLTGKNHEQYKNKHILLVDDLMTTGATLKAAARELIKLRPASIRVVVGARAIY